MSFFERQVAKRRASDAKMLNHAFNSIVDSIYGECFSYESSSDAYDSILKYYKLDSVNVPTDIKDNDLKVEYFCHVSGLLQRPVKLNEDWYKEAFGAFLGKLKDSEEVVAITPNIFGIYYYFDKEKNKKIYMNKKNAKNLDVNGMCFYKPLPDKKLNIYELLKFSLSSWTIIDIIFIIAFTGVITLLGLLSPKISYFIYNDVIYQKDISLLISTLIFMICVSISTLLFRTFSSMFNARANVRLESYLKVATMMRVLSFPTSFFRKYSDAEILSKLDYPTSICRSIIDMVFNTGVTSLFSLSYIGSIFKYAPSLVIPALIVICVTVGYSLVITFAQIKLSKESIAYSNKVSDLTFGLFGGIQKIKLAGAEKRVFSKWADAFADSNRITYNPPFFIKYSSVFSLIISLSGTLVMYAVALQAKISVAEYYAFTTSYGLLSGAFSSLASITTRIASLKPTIDLVQPILKTLPESSSGSKVVTSLKGDIEINDITFRYDDKSANIYNDLSLKIPAGQYLAIVGKTGCGKSTLVRLLLGFETPQIGAIFYDGQDIKQLDKQSLRKNIGTVMQDDKLFTGDIYSNIVICAPHLNVDKAWEAAELACIADDIRDMPMGMNTLISEGSGGISGGQKQRLMIARAVAPSPKILIFDEATSALDNITQKKICESLDALKCTRIVIAHRLSTIKHCDRIIVIEDGKIIEDGTYDELIKQKGFFFELVDRQRLDKGTDGKD